MRRLFIIRKDLRLSAGKLAAMCMHCAEAYWTNFLKRGLICDMEFITLETADWINYRNPRISDALKAAYDRGEKYCVIPEENPIHKYALKQTIDKDVWDNYVNGIFTKTVCEAKNLNQLRKVTGYIEEINAGLPESKRLRETVDYGWINDKCLTELRPENEDGTTTVGIWFGPMPDEIAHRISMKYKLYKDDKNE